MTTGPVVRLADADDSDSLIALRQRWTEERRGVGPDQGFAERFRTWLADKAGHRTFWIAELARRPIGMVNLLTFTRMPGPNIEAGAWGYLGNMYVVPEHRDAGVGRHLLDALLAHADAAGLERVVLSPTEPSVPFYRRAGFGPADQLLLRHRDGTDTHPTGVQPA